MHFGGCTRCSRLVRRWNMPRWWGLKGLKAFALEAFTPYRHGPAPDSWRLFGQREIALAASGLLNDQPRPLRPREDPHVASLLVR